MSMNTSPSNDLPCLPLDIALPRAVVETFIPVAREFDVDNRTGFMAPRPPIARLPTEWELWEELLDEAVAAELQLGDKIGLTHGEAVASREWRTRACEMPVLSVEHLEKSAELLRRAHLVLAYILHFYVQTSPPGEPMLIPAPISLPMLRVSRQLDIPPLLTFSDTVLFNWAFRVQPNSEDAIPTPENIRIQTMFTNTRDEEEFYLCSARIELVGVEILELMRLTMDEIFVGDHIAVRRIAQYLETIAGVIIRLKTILLDVRKLCDPDVYYNQVRPWFRGEDAIEHESLKRKWVFEDIETDGILSVPIELSGPSAGQSSMIHIIDIFLGVDHDTTSSGRRSFMSRMQAYMPRNHQIFLDHLKANPRPLRDFVKCNSDHSLLEAYNKVVIALKEFRDAHMIIATLYILGPARRAAKLASQYAGKSPHIKQPGASLESDERKVLKGTGGTDLVKFLKDTRTRTTNTVLPKQI